jgi:hypothetical protein
VTGPVVTPLMRPEESLQQRALDGVLPREQAAGLAGMLASRPALAQQAAALQALDADLRQISQNTAVLTSEAHSEVGQLRLRQAIMARVATRVPASQVRVRPLDVIYAAAAAVLVFAAYGLTRATVQTLFEQAVVMTWAIGLSLTLGLLLLILPSFLRRAEASLLRTVMRRPIAIGPADILIYRAVGMALVVGGIWLTY